MSKQKPTPELHHTVDLVSDCTTQRTAVPLTVPGTNETALTVFAREKAESPHEFLANVVLHQFAGRLLTEVHRVLEHQEGRAGDSDWYQRLRRVAMLATYLPDDPSETSKD